MKVGSQFWFHFCLVFCACDGQSRRRDKRDSDDYNICYSLQTKSLQPGPGQCPCLLNLIDYIYTTNDPSCHTYQGSLIVKQSQLTSALHMRLVSLCDFVFGSRLLSKTKPKSRG